MGVSCSKAQNGPDMAIGLLVSVGPRLERWTLKALINNT